MPQAIVIGAGLGGIAAALRLRKKGYAVTLLDKQSQLGGRATAYRKNGFVFDAGPTVITAHFLFDELFQLFGKRREDYVTFTPLYPWYRIQFADGSTFDYGGTLEQTLAQINKFDPTGHDAAGYQKLLAHTKRIFDVGFTQLGDQPFETLWSMLKVSPELVKLGTWRTVWQMTCKYVQNENLRRVFSFQPLLVGGNPFNTTSIYSLIHYLEREWGVHFAMGGTGAIVAALGKLMEEEGVRIRLNAEVAEVVCGPDRTAMNEIIDNTKGRAALPMAAATRVRGVRLANGDTLPTDLVVANADAPALYRRLIPAPSRKKWTDRRLEKMQYSMGLFVLYFGTTRTYPDVAHHTIILGRQYGDLLRDMFDRHQLEMSDFSVYLHRPTATDPSMAPAGCDSFYVLVPVPNLQGEIDWSKIGPKYRDLVVDYLERTHLPGLRECITEDFYVTPQHFRDNLNTHHGTGFSIQPTFRQSAYWRFHNRSEDVAGLYLVGAGTHPGAGMPGVLCSAKVIEKLIPDPT
jgi:phytoene desaturase